MSAAFSEVKASLRVAMFGGSITIQPEPALLVAIGLPVTSSRLVTAARAESAIARALSSSACPLIGHGFFRGAVPDEACGTAVGGVMARGLTTATARITADCTAVGDAAAYRAVLLAALGADVTSEAAGAPTKFNISATAIRTVAVQTSAEDKSRAVLSALEPWYGAAMRAAASEAAAEILRAEANAVSTQTTLAGALLGTYVVLLLAFILPRVRWLRRVIRASRLMINVVPGEALLAVPILGRAVRDLVKAEREVVRASEASRSLAVVPRARAACFRARQRVRVCCCCCGGCGTDDGAPPAGVAGQPAKYTMRVMDEDELSRVNSAILQAVSSRPGQGSAVSPAGLLAHASAFTADDSFMSTAPPISGFGKSSPPSSLGPTLSGGGTPGVPAGKGRRPPPPRRRLASSSMGIQPPPRPSSPLGPSSSLGLGPSSSLGLGDNAESDLDALIRR